MIYRGQDGRDKFTDTGPRIVMQDKADDTLEAALRMAAQKYGGKVDVTGGSEFRERAARQAVRLGIKVANADLQAIVADEQARMHQQRAPARATKENQDTDQPQGRKHSEPGLRDKTGDLSPELVDKPTPQSPSPASRRHSAESPEKQATAPAPISPKQAMEQAMEQWLDGDRSSGPVKAFIAAHDRATRQGADGRKLIADVVDRVITRRGEGVDQAVGGFIAEIGRQRNREQGVGR